MHLTVIFITMYYLNRFGLKTDWIKIGLARTDLNLNMPVPFRKIQVREVKLVHPLFFQKAFYSIEFYLIYITENFLFKLIATYSNK